MVFKKKYQDYYYAKVWKPYTLISQREINAIIKQYGFKPSLNPKDIKRIPYDEFTNSDKSLKHHSYRGNKTYQIAVTDGEIFLRLLDKHISTLKQKDLEDFRLRVKRYLGLKELVFRSDNRFKRLRLSQYWETFTRKEHNAIHRFIAVAKNRHYRKGLSYPKALRLTSESFGKDLVYL